MPRTGTKGARGATASLVPVRGTNRDQRVELVPVRATNRDQWPCTAAWWWEFSPTSLVERGAQWFISPTAAPLSSSSPLQAYGPNCHCYAWWAYWAFCGPESWPMDGFLVVFRPWWPSRWHIFYFLPVFCFLFCFIYFVLFLLTTKNLFILFYFVSNYLFILLYDNSFCY